MTEDWTGNYFNYFTEIEEHFQKARGTHLFLLSPLDWALIEGWKNSGVPLDAVLRGIDAAFEKWRARKSKTRMVNSLAYCTQEVLAEAQAAAGAIPANRGRPVSPPFPIEDLKQYLAANAASVRKAGQDDIASTLDRLAAEAETHFNDLEQLEQRLSALEEKMIATARASQTDEELFQDRRTLNEQLRAYRSRMTTDQLAMLEKQFLERALLERLGLPRLSLFYLR